MRLPAYYQISNRLSEDQIEQVQQILAYTPLDCAVIDDPADVLLARRLSQLVLTKEALPGLTGRARFAVLGDFDSPLTAVYDANQKVILC